VNGVLAIGEHLRIITDGHHLSVGTRMTFCRGDGRVFLTYLGLPFAADIAAIFFATRGPSSAR